MLSVQTFMPRHKAYDALGSVAEIAQLSTPMRIVLTKAEQCFGQNV